ncbi:hypothetical protein ACS65S_13240, partial [Staphylococcus saprophyticus]
QAADFDESNELLKPKGVEIARMTDKTITYKHIKEDKKCVVANLVKIITRRSWTMALDLRNKDEIDNLNDKLDQILKL